MKEAGEERWVDTEVNLRSIEASELDRGNPYA
jgi:hypothetical protein